MGCLRVRCEVSSSSERVGVPASEAFAFMSPRTRTAVSVNARTTASDLSPSTNLDQV